MPTCTSAWSTGARRIIEVEALFKAFARALRFAVSATTSDSRNVLPGTKGLLARPTVTLIDYGAGNVTSVDRALQKTRSRIDAR